MLQIAWNERQLAIQTYVERIGSGVQIKPVEAIGMISKELPNGRDKQDRGNRNYDHTGRFHEGSCGSVIDEIT